MTLVAAFRCRDNGILLCADKEYDDSITKNPVDKIYRETSLPDCEVFLAGSGPATMVFDSYQEIHRALAIAAHQHKTNIVTEHPAIIEDCLRIIHAKHKQDVKWMPLCLLVVVAPHSKNTFPILYRSERTTLIPESEYAAAGTGKILSDYFAIHASLYRYGLTDAELAVLAAFILREAEKSASGVGLGNDMIFIGSGGVRRELHTKSIAEIQAGIPSLMDAIQSYWSDHVKIPVWFKRYAASAELPE